MTTRTRLLQYKKYKLFLFSITLLFSSQIINAQTQIGMDINGESSQDYSGSSVSMPDAFTVAIGALYNDENGSNSGHVRIYKWDGTNWIQKGGDIDGQAAFDQSGISVSMPDSNTVAIGAIEDVVNRSRDIGYTRIYRWNGANWIQKGGDIVGEAIGDESGFSVSMPDSNTIAIGATLNDGNGNNSGHARIYIWNDTSWVQKGGDIDGDAAGDNSGTSVSMPDSNTVAIGSPYGSSHGSGSGDTRIFSWNGTAWVQKGTDISGVVAGDYSGWSVSMSDSNTVAIGSPYSNLNSSGVGHVRVFRWNKVIGWVQKGTHINENGSWSFGKSVSLSDSNTLAVGSPYPLLNKGKVYIYSWNGISWVQKGVDIVGEANGDLMGESVSMPDSNTLATGAPVNNGQMGHVRIYSICNNAINNHITRTAADTIVADDTTANYQWVNCDSAFASIAGENERKFTINNSGNYAVIVSKSHCVDTSNCAYVTITGLNKEKSKQAQFTAYPNPTNGSFTIQNDAKKDYNLYFEVRTIEGKIVTHGKLKGEQTKVDLSNFNNGVYILKVNGRFIKIIKNE